MSADLETELREGLRAYTAPVSARPGLLVDVRRGGARRRVHRRLAVALAPVAAVAVVGAAALAVPRLADRAPTATAADERLLALPTTGDLAADRPYLEQVRAVFLAGVRPAEERGGGLPTPQPGAAPSGDPHVLWAATTAVGRAAVVVQRERTPGGAVVAIGYLGPGAGGPRLVAVGRNAEGYPDYAGAFVGAQREVLLALDRGEPLNWSSSHSYLKPAGLRLDDRPVRFTDPVVALIVPAGVHPAEVELTRPGSPALDRPLPVGNRADTPDGPRLPWFGAKRDPDSSIFPVADAQAWPDARGDRRTQLYLALHRPVEAVPSDRWLAGSAGHDAWYAYGATPDGRRLVGTDLAALGDPSRAYAVLLDGGGRATVVDGGTVDRVSAVPFRVRLPDGQGWLVAAKGSELSWRVGSGAWTSAGRDAALLPAPATEVRAGAARVPLR